MALRLRPLRLRPLRMRLERLRGVRRLRRLLLVLGTLQPLLKGAAAPVVERDNLLWPGLA